jgi:hypothetical protein
LGQTLHVKSNKKVTPVILVIVIYDLFNKLFIAASNGGTISEL